VPFLRPVCIAGGRDPLLSNSSSAFAKPVISGTPHRWNIRVSYALYAAKP
jgi:hypothetical protein